MNSETATANDVDSVRRQLRQLLELHDGGALDSAAYEQSKAALERTLVDLVLHEPPASSRPADMAELERQSRWLFIGIAVFVATVTIAGYWWLGSPGMIGVGPGSVAAAGAGRGDVSDASAHDTTPERIAGMVDQLSQRLKRQPGDAEGWAMLARSYAVLSRHADAVPAYERALALRPDDAALLADYADALAMKNNQGLAGEPMKFVERALKLDPQNLKALSLSATDAFDRKDYALAVQRWERVVAIGPEDNPLVQQVKGSISEARELGRLPAAAQATASPNAAARSVSGAVALAPALSAKVAPTDTVFVTARAVDGPRMPLAVVRKQARDLPFEFRLDDSMAMSPTLKLSGFSKVVVSARVSRRGDAAAVAGELSGRSAPVAVGSGGVRVVIDEVIQQSP